MEIDATEIHWDDIQIDQAGTQCNLSANFQHLSQWTFTPILTGRIRPGIKDWPNWVELGVNQLR